MTTAADGWLPEASARASLEDHFEVCGFLFGESELLDGGRYRDWLGLLSQDIAYRMPVRVTRAHTLDDSVLDDMDHFEENRYSLEKRVERFETEHAWTEDPPSRTRRFVTNIRVSETDHPELVRARSNILLFRSRGDVRAPEWVSAERHDVLRRAADELELARRLILVDESVIRTQNLAVFL